MIIKRIRKGRLRRRGSIVRLVADVIALSNYVIDADPEKLTQLVQVRNMSAYALDAEMLDDLGVSPGEKVSAYGVFNLQGDSLQDWQIDMAAVAARCPRSHSPLEHYVISWQGHESPTSEQAEEAAQIFVDVMGFGECQVIWSRHSNTCNEHLHVLGNRVHPVTGAMIQAGDGWDKDRMGQAIAIIEERQGWEAEPNARFFARQGAVYEVKTGALVRTTDGQQAPRRKRKAEQPTPGGDDRLANKIVRAVTGASDWLDLHERLRPLGAEYDRAGSGATIMVAGKVYKASEFHRDCSRKAVEKRLGQFEPDPQRESSVFEAYRQACRDEVARIRSVRASELARLDDHLAATLSDVVGNLSGPVAKLVTASIKAEFGSARLSLNAAFAGAMDQFANSRLSLHDWRGLGQPVAPSATCLPSVVAPLAVSGAEQPVRVAEGAGGLRRMRKEWHTEYRDADDRLVFVDHRHVIIMHQPDLDYSTYALSIAAKRWKKVRVVGPPDFVQMSIRIATEHGFDLVDINGRPLAKKAKPPRKVRAATVPASPQHTAPVRVISQAAPSPPPNSVTQAPSPQPSAGVSVEDQAAWLASKSAKGR